MVGCITGREGGDVYDDDDDDDDDNNDDDDYTEYDVNVGNKDGNKKDDDNIIFFTQQPTLVGCILTRVQTEQLR